MSFFLSEELDKNGSSKSNHFNPLTLYLCKRSSDVIRELVRDDMK